ncbi:hypothetical protein BpHYR1_001172 [Brachionus plicatilis]|uniref:Uncharacterized protein n=1 Tax=Brachionus plicatilis TaxID=10195 RepID=A0A3M7PC94_BRAPC|nr:hypothetical protein BpHYR1_001172 [Brachionus plicatilis]
MCLKFQHMTGHSFLEWNDSHKIVEMNKQCWQLSRCSCPFANIIEKNASKGRRKKALPALIRNSIGPINQELFSLQTNSNLAETPITIETQSIESEPSIQIALLTANDNSSQTVQKRGRGPSRKNDLVQTLNVTQKILFCSASSVVEIFFSCFSIISTFVSSVKDLRFFGSVSDDLDVETFGTDFLFNEVNF